MSSTPPPTRPDVPASSSSPGPRRELDLDRIVRAHGPSVYRVAVAVLHDHLAAEDVVQDVMLKVWHRWQGGDDVDQRWLNVVARNTAIDALRRRRFEWSSDDRTERASGEASHDDVVIARERLRSVWDALETLDPDVRAMLVLRETDDVSYDDLAAMFDLTIPQVKTKLYRARFALRNRLADLEEER